MEVKKSIIGMHVSYIQGQGHVSSPLKYAPQGFIQG